MFRKDAIDSFFQSEEARLPLEVYATEIPEKKRYTFINTSYTILIHLFVHWESFRSKTSCK